MMKQHSKTVACFAILVLTSVISLIDTSGATSKSDEPIGQNVSLRAHVFYDPAYLRNPENKDQGKPTENSEEPMKEYFEKLFGEVEKYFHNKSIMIKVMVDSVSKHNFTRQRGKHFDANGTLQELITHGKTLAKSNDTVFYYFTWTNLIFNGDVSTKPNAVGQSDVETFGTFCTENTSGAVIRHQNRSGNPWTTAKATAFVFGSGHFILFTEKDRENMKEKFSHCPVGTPPVPAC